MTSKHICRHIKTFFLYIYKTPHSFLIAHESLGMQGAGTHRPLLLLTAEIANEKEGAAVTTRISGAIDGKCIFFIPRG